jgi:hypothetical protein
MAKDIADIGMSIDVSKTYLPADTTEKLSTYAREHYALYSLNTAQQMIYKGSWETAKNQIREALNLSCSPKVVVQLFAIFNISTRQFIKQRILKFNPSNGAKNV